MNKVYLLRGICGVAVLIVAYALSTQLFGSKDPVSASAEIANVPGASNSPSERGVVLGSSPLESGVLPTAPTPLLPHLAGDAGDVQADDIAPELKHPLTRSLGSMIDSNRELFDQVGGGELGQSLLEADEILWKSKQNNRDAIRMANRQVRISGQTPNVILVTVDGLQLPGEPNPAESTDTMPALYWMGQQGIVSKIAAGEPAAERYSLVTGLHSVSNESLAGPAPISQSFWQSSFETAVMGETSWWGAADPASDWDSWLGFRAEDESLTFPTKVWSNGRQIGLKANADGGQGVSARRLFAQETLTYVARRRRGRPFLLCLSLRVDPAEALARGAQAERARHNALGDIDGVLQEIDLQLSLLGLTNRTLVAVVGLSSSDPSTDLGKTDQRSNVLVLRSPNRLAAGMRMPQTIRYEDLLPTLLDATSSHRRPRKLDGVSRWKSFLHATVETAGRSVR